MAARSSNRAIAPHRVEQTIGEGWTLVAGPNRRELLERLEKRGGVQRSLRIVFVLEIDINVAALT
jgi:hypothetical protein